VPRLCLDPAFLPVLALLAECRISNLLNQGVECGFKSPSPHHSKLFILNDLPIGFLSRTDYVPKI
jgi:hypothetical protein